MKSLHTEEGAHPLVILLFYKMRLAGYSMKWMSERCQFSRATIARWRGRRVAGVFLHKGNDPNLINLDRAFQALGKRVIIIDADLLPPNQFEISSERTIREILTRILIRQPQ